MVLANELDSKSSVTAPLTCGTLGLALFEGPEKPTTTFCHVLPPCIKQKSPEHPLKVLLPSLERATAHQEPLRFAGMGKAEACLAGAT